jgi:hypothetical protein
VQQWWEESNHRQYTGSEAEEYVVSMAAQWGADQELEACCETLDMVNGSNYWSQVLRSGRRPKPPRLKEQALALINRRIGDGYVQMLTGADAETIRRALEALDD